METQQITIFLDGLQAKVNPRRELQSATGEDGGVRAAGGGVV